MKLRALAFACLIVGFASPSQAIVFSDDISTLDAVAVDASWGLFYYDLYYLTVDNPTSIYLTLTPDPSDPFAPWLGYWDGDFSAVPDYDTPFPVDYASSNVEGLELDLTFNALPNIEYQIMVATWDYYPTTLGAYDLTILNSEQTDFGFTASASPILIPQSVPAPDSWIILGLGLIVLGMVHRLGIAPAPAIARC